MPTADELRASLAAGRTVLRTAIAASAEVWDTPKGKNDEGDGPGWSPRQTAEHVIPAEIMLAGGVCAACGYDGPENPLGEGEPSFESADDALAALDAVAAAADAKIKHVQDEELGKSAGGEGLAALSAAALLTSNVWHLADHAAQMMRPDF